MDDRKKKARVGGGAASQKQQQPLAQTDGVNNNNNNNNKKKRKNKRRRNTQRKGGVVSSSANRGLPLTPSVKITIRNIRDTDVAQTIRSLIINANIKHQSAASSSSLEPVLVLDDKTLEKLVDDEKMAVAAMSKWQKEIESKGKNESNAVEVEGTNATKSEVEIKSTTTDIVEPLIVDMKKSMFFTEQMNGTSNDNRKDQMVVVRVLYMIPPRKTRRRGDKPGIAYLLLTAPPIVAKVMSMTELHPITEEDNNVDTVEDQEAPAATSSPPMVTVPTSTVINGAATEVDYSRDIARRRLLLDNALELLQTTAMTSPTTNTDPSMMMVIETSMNDKIWKQQAFSSNSPVDRMANTIFQTDDYQQFILNNQRTEEERKARPKPPPGGGVTSHVPLATSSTTTANTSTALLTKSSSGTTTNTASGNGAPVAALVLHLQKKQEEENMRKLTKRKEKDAKSSKKNTVKPQKILPTGTGNNKNRTSGAQPSSSSSTTATNANKSKKHNNSRRVRKPKNGNQQTDSTSKNNINRGGGGGG